MPRSNHSEPPEPPAHETFLVEKRKVRFGIYIQDFDKFVATTISAFLFIVGCTWGTVSYFKNIERNEDIRTAEAPLKEQIAEYKTQLFILEHTKEFASKEDLKQFQINIKKGISNEK